MRKIVVIVIVVAIVTSSCAQPAKQQKEENLNAADTLSAVDNFEMPELPNSTENELFHIQKIDSISYFSAKEKSNIPPKADLNKITDLAQAKEMLKAQVVWGRYDEETNKMIEDEQSDIVYKVIFRNGKIVLYEYPEIGFIAYFPQEDILFLEGAHTTDLIFNLTTGAETEDIGDPEHIRYSSSKQRRLNTYYSGQSTIYFIQEKSRDEYKTTVDMESLNSASEKLIGFGIDYLPDAFWQNDTVLYFVLPYYYDEGRKEIKLYYRLTLKEVNE